VNRSVAQSKADGEVGDLDRRRLNHRRLPVHHCGCGRNRAPSCGRRPRVDCRSGRDAAKPARRPPLRKRSGSGSGNPKAG
jgi:hypothetical protein